jgi:Protein of unknown function (DUF3591)
MNFGNVEPGQTILALYNNLIRAPLFRQNAPSTDFLVIRNTHKGQPKYFIREIPTMFVVGQTYPVQEVPGPHSRKITTMVKNRLQVSAFRIIRQSQHHRLRIDKLRKQFPEYSEGQIRQRLKVRHWADALSLNRISDSLRNFLLGICRVPTKGQQQWILAPETDDSSPERRRHTKNGYAGNGLPV